MDTIYALASGAPPTAIAVVRLSGPATNQILDVVTANRRPAPRRAALRSVVSPDGDEIDQALVLCFAAPASYTGELAAEIHLHGGEAVIASFARTLERLGARLAEPGEFSRRALTHGKADVSQIEAVADLIAAETESQRRHALRLLDGEMGRTASRWREMLVEAIALLETSVDFVEESLGADINHLALVAMTALRKDLSEHLESPGAEVLSQTLPTIAIIGPPNAGKSSLLNAISGDDAAIVTDIPGTTRDAILVSLQFSGRKLALVDTAGIRATEDPVERLGVERSERAALEADRRIFVFSADTAAEFPRFAAYLREGDALFWTKSDLAPVVDERIEQAAFEHSYVVSARDSSARAGLAAYLDQALTPTHGALSPLAGSERRRMLARRALERMEAAEAAARADQAELAIEELRRAWTELSALTGAVDNEAVLDALFSTFCIGK